LGQPPFAPLALAVFEPLRSVIVGHEEHCGVRRFLVVATSANGFGVGLLELRPGWHVVKVALPAVKFEFSGAIAAIGKKNYSAAVAGVFLLWL
jgi:hypothetical protein